MSRVEQMRETDKTKAEAEAKTYKAPTLTVHGKVAELTAAGQSGSGEDSFSPHDPGFKRVHS